jgi:hypothetical protein
MTAGKQLGDHRIVRRFPGAGGETGDVVLGPDAVEGVMSAGMPLDE